MRSGGALAGIWGLGMLHWQDHFVQNGSHGHGMRELRWLGASLADASVQSLRLGMQALRRLGLCLGRVESETQPTLVASALGRIWGYPERFA